MISTICSPSSAPQTRLPAPPRFAGRCAVAAYIDAYLRDRWSGRSKLTAQFAGVRSARQPLNRQVFNVGAQGRIALRSSFVRWSAVGSDRGSASTIPIVMRSPTSRNSNPPCINLAVNGRDAMDGEGQTDHRCQEGAEQSRRSVPNRRGGRFHRSRAGRHRTASHPIILRQSSSRSSPPGSGKGNRLGLSQAFGFAKQSGWRHRGCEHARTSATIHHLSAAGGNSQSTRPKPMPSARPEVDHRAAAIACSVVDNDDDRTVLDRVAGDLGYTVRRVAEANAALDILAEDEFSDDLVFSDVTCPGMNGVRTGRRHSRAVSRPAGGADQRITATFLAENAHRGIRTHPKTLFGSSRVADPAKRRLASG